LLRFYEVRKVGLFRSRVFDSGTYLNPQLFFLGAYRKNDMMYYGMPKAFNRANGSLGKEYA